MRKHEVTGNGAERLRLPIKRLWKDKVNGRSNRTDKGYRICHIFHNYFEATFIVYVLFSIPFPSRKVTYVHCETASSDEVKV